MLNEDPLIIEYNDMISVLDADYYVVESVTKDQKDEIISRYRLQR